MLKAIKHTDKQDYYLCPVDGFVSPESSYTHKYEVSREGHELTVRVINYSYMTNNPITCTFDINLNELDKFVNWSKVIGNRSELIQDLPPEFIETLIHFYEKAYPVLSHWEPLYHWD